MRKPRACAGWIVALLLLGGTAAVAAGPGTREAYGLVVLIDGARGDRWKRYADEGRLPHVKRLFLDGGVWVEHATTVFPTITGAGVPSVLTGNVPGRHGIPSLYFFDRVERKYPILYLPGEALGWDQWLSPAVKTIWEHFPGPGDALSMGPALHRGADEHASVLWNVGYAAMELRGKLKLWRRALGRVLGVGKLARLTVVYNGWFDHQEHGHGSTYEQIGEHYQNIDEFVGEAVAVFDRAIDARREALRRRDPEAVVERYVALVSDHGHQDVREVHSIDRFVRDRKGAKVLDKVWTKILGQKVAGSIPEDYSDRELLVAAGEGHALLYFPTPVLAASGDRVESLDWSRAPPLEQLRDYPFRDSRVDIVAEAVQQPAVSFLVGKHRGTGAVHVFSAAGEATIERSGSLPTRAGYRYRVVRGQDPLGYAADPEVAPLVDGRFHHADEWQRRTFLTEYPDGPVMLYQPFDDAVRAPDLYLSAAPYVSIGDAVDGEKSASKHGGLTKEESWATLAFHGTGLTPGTIRTARNLDMVPTMLHLLGQRFDPDGVDGRVLPEIARRLEPGAVVPDPGPGPGPGRPATPGELHRPRVPDYVGGVNLGGSTALRAEAELRRIRALPAGPRRVALRNLAARPPYRFLSATAVIQRARGLYLAEHASGYHQEVARRLAASPEVDPGRLEGDAEEVLRVRREAWEGLLAALEAAELAPVVWTEATMARLLDADPAARQAFEDLLGRIDAELEAFAAWKGTSKLEPLDRARRKQAYQDLRDRRPDVAALTRAFLAAAYDPAPVTPPAPVASPVPAPDFEGLGGPVR